MSTTFKISLIFSHPSFCLPYWAFLFCLVSIITRVLNAHLSFQTIYQLTGSEMKNVWRCLVRKMCFQCWESVIRNIRYFQGIFTYISYCSQKLINLMNKILEKKKSLFVLVCSREREITTQPRLNSTSYTFHIKMPIDFSRIRIWMLGEGRIANNSNIKEG